MAAVLSRPFLLTSVGKKYLMGVTGLVWVGFVLVHMSANMLILVSPSLYNAYGHAITGNKPLLYLSEAVLLLAVAIHVTMAILLTRENIAARPKRYATQPNGEKGTSLASKTMAPQGLMILIFIILHLSTFKYGEFYATTVNGVEMRDLHRLVLEVFKNPGYVCWYIICLILLGFHLSHGVGSIFQSLGVRNDKWAPLIKKISIGYGIIVGLGFLSQPIYVFFLSQGR